MERAEGIPKNIKGVSVYSFSVEFHWKEKYLSLSEILGTLNRFAVFMPVCGIDGRIYIALIALLHIFPMQPLTF